jgi:outer membrane protein
MRILMVSLAALAAAAPTTEAQTRHAQASAPSMPAHASAQPPSGEPVATAPAAPTPAPAPAPQTTPRRSAQYRDLPPSESLSEAMLAAVQTSPTLAASRQRLNATREALPQAWAAALPQIGFTANAGTTDVDAHSLPDTPASKTFTTSFSGSQLLFASGRIIGTTRSASAEIRGAVADYDQGLQQLLLDVATAYANMLQQQEVVAAQQTTADNLTTLYQYAQAEFNAGVVTRTDVAQAEARLAQARTELVQAQGALAAAVQAFVRLIGHPPSGLATPEEAAGLPTDLDNALDIAGRNSFVLMSAVAAVDQANANVLVAASAGGPQVSLEAGHDESGVFHEHGAGETTDSVGLRLTMPLFQGGQVLSRTRQESALARAANYDLVSAQRTVEEGVTNAWTGLASARAAVDSAQEQVTASELAYRGIRLEQQTGLRSTIDVLNQEQDLLTAHLALAQAKRDLIVAERQMLFSIGRLQVPEAPPAPRDGLHGR